MSTADVHDVCLVLEGARPDRAGGVATWVDGLLASAGDLNMAVARLTDRPSGALWSRGDGGRVSTVELDVGDASSNELAALLPPARCYHALSTSEAGEVALSAARMNGARLLITEHGLAWREVTTGPGQLESGRRVRGDRHDVVATARARAVHLLRAADRVTTVCKHNAQAQWDLAGVRSQVISNTVALPVLHARQPRSRTPLVALIGRVAALKDVLTFVRAAALVQHPTAEFVVIGPLDDDEQHATLCLDELARCGLGQRLRFVGTQDVADWLPHLDLVVSTSISEAMPYALIEAMAASIPVVATEVGGVPGLIGRGQNAAGLLAPARRPDLLAAHIDAVLASAALATRLGANGRSRIAITGSASSHFHNYHQLHRELAA
jgi:glycosyltransferase involved in cell wall biosynthesis